MSDTNWAFTYIELGSGAVRHWNLRGPHGLVRFEVVDGNGISSTAVYLHASVAPAGGQLEDCDECGECWRDAMSNSLASDLREDWETFSRNDNVILTQLQRWYNEELSTPPVPVSEGSQVSGEVGPVAGGPQSNLAATGAGNGGVVPVPVAARVTATAIRQALHDSLSPNFEIDSDAYDDAAVAVALLLEPQPAWGSGPLVDHNPETLRTQREMDADLYENWVANQEAGTGSADPEPPAGPPGPSKPPRLPRGWNVG